MNFQKAFLSALLSIFIFSQSGNTVRAQSGDQILDGIGETGMVARYIFNGDLKDWSRNTLHGKTQGSGVKYIDDSRFGKVLSISGAKDAYVTIPGMAMTDLESLSISGWIYLRSTQPGQYFFDFGQNPDKHFFAAPLGTKAQPGLQALITSGPQRTAAVSPAIENNKWVHLAVVIDVPSKSMQTYVNGKPAGESTDIPQELSAVFDHAVNSKNLLYIGKSISPANPNLDAMLHDFRIYRVPLSRRQVAGIYNNARKGAQQNGVNVGKQEDDLPKFPATEAQLYNRYLNSVADISVQTVAGVLPRLPATIPGVYQNGKNGPKVRVIWPAEMDNSAALKPGRYTVTGRVPGTAFQPKALVNVKASAPMKTPEAGLEAFELNQVSLATDATGQQTKFIENRDKFIKTLANTEPNSFLYMFRHAFGQKQPGNAVPLGVWDSQDTKLRGHATGHYLTAIAQAYAGTGYDKNLQQNFAGKMEYMVNTLYELAQLSGRPQRPGSPHVFDPGAIPYGPGKSTYDSDLSDTGIRNDYWNWGKGFISAYPPDQFIMLENGAKYGGQKNQIWAPYYTLHKILAGLIDIYEVSGNKKALEIAVNMGEWVHARLSRVPQDTLIKMWNTYIAGEFGGMNESMAHLYRITGNENFLKTARLFDNVKVFYGDPAHVHGLAKNVDLFRGLHANQHIPQVVGSIEMYKVSRDPEYYYIADNFWHKITDDYMYSIGGVAGARNPANAECFIAQPASLYQNGFSEGGQNETCATYNMLKLTSDLFLFDQRAELMDYYERGLYNHILASVAEHTPANTYHVPLRPGSIKQFGNPDMTGFTCCNGTAIESSTKLQNAIYFRSKDNKALYVNLFVPSSLNWRERKVSIEQTTNFPKADHTKLTVRGSGKFDIHVRVAHWATNGYFVKINGKPEPVNAIPGTYLKLSRKWNNGDVIEIQMPFQFHLDPVMDQPNIASLFYGPILLAAQEPLARKEWHKITLDADDLSKSITGDPAQLQFKIGDVLFKPFYDSYGRHSVYLDVTLK